MRSQLKADAKRDTVLDAALALFTERGFEGTSVPMIADQAGVGVGTIYRYFEHKEALVNAVYQTWKQAFYDKLTTDFPTQADPRTQFSFLWNRMAEFAREHPLAFAFLEMHHHTPYLDEASYAIMAKLTGFLRDYVVQGQFAKPLPPDALIAMVFGGFVGLFKSEQAGEIELTPEVLALAEASFWDAIAR